VNEALGISKDCVVALVDNKIDGLTLMTITDSDLKECGVCAMGDRKHLLRERDELLRLPNHKEEKPDFMDSWAKMVAADDPGAITTHENGGMSIDVAAMMRSAQARGLLSKDAF
jgi:SAM domain (Sterile alpha motif)